MAKAKARVQLLGSGSILNEALKAQQILGEKYGVAADVWSVTSYNELRREALKTERWNMLHPAEAAKIPYVQQVLGATEGPIVAASDYMKAVQDQISPWLGGRMCRLGTDGFGRSDNRDFPARAFRSECGVDRGGGAVAAGARGQVRRQRRRRRRSWNWGSIRRNRRGYSIR